MEWSVASTSQRRIDACQSAGEAASSGLLFASMSGLYTRWSVVVGFFYLNRLLREVVLYEYQQSLSSSQACYLGVTVHKDGRRVTLAVFITDLPDNPWTPVHISVAPALSYKRFCCSMCPQLAGPTLREVTMQFRQRNCVCVWERDVM